MSAEIRENVIPRDGLVGGQDENRRLVEERRKAEAEKYGKKNSVCNSDGEIKLDNKLISDCIDDKLNMLGPGLLYAAKFKNKIIQQMPTEKIYECQPSGVWTPDHSKSYLSCVEDVVGELLRFQSTVLSEQMTAAIENGDKNRLAYLQKCEKNLFKIVKRLRSVNGRKDCTAFAFTNKYNGLTATIDEFDNNPDFFPAKNVNVCSKSGRSMERHPGQLITITSRADYFEKHACAEKFEACPTFGKFLTSLWPGKEGSEIISYLRRLCGYVLTGKCTEHVIIILSGAGRNGKSTLIELMHYILGDLAWNFPAELLLDQGRVRNPDAPTPTLISFMSKLLVSASESEDGRRWNAAAAKKLTGDDTLTGREPHGKKEISFRRTHTLFFLCNHLPIAPANDFAFWERVHVIPFKKRFVLHRDPNPQDPNEMCADKDLPEKLRMEASAILGWMVYGCFLWQKEGLKPPLAISEATAKYRREEDILQDWIDERCILHKDARGVSSELHEDFNEWFQQNVSKKGITPHKFGRLMGQRFEKEKHGKYVYVGIGLKDKVFS